MVEKITRRHLDRVAIVYVRQSSTQQVVHNEESRRLQYAMKQRVELLGWKEVITIDDYMGRSAATTSERGGFQRMVAEICLGRTGTVAAREVWSRIASPTRESCDSFAGGSKPACSKEPNGRTRRKERRRGRASARSWPTSSCTASSISGCINGAEGARGRVGIVRYADDFVMGFQYEADARQMLADLRERLGKFKLSLHEDKTRLLQFGKMSSELKEKRGQRRCETFSFLGFTHICARSRQGRSW